MMTNGRHQSADFMESALRERVKELSCLYGIARIVARHHTTFAEIMQDIVDLLPMAWQYSEVAHARITIDGQPYETKGFVNSSRRLSAPVKVFGRKRGTVEVCYPENAGIGTGTFLEEERKLIRAVAREVASAVGSREAEEDKARLHQQLQHADRLATIGILSSGVAHELNEPLGSILGYAQLAKKCCDLPAQVKSDIEKIESAALHAREVIRNLLLFTRQAPSRKRSVNLNDIVTEGLYFFVSRCEKHGVKLIHLLDPSLPYIHADPAQMNQVLVNLVVNALHAMPEGGKLILRTKTTKKKYKLHVSLMVADTGTGIPEEVREKLFIPFFTTKDVGQGTGLGLPVVHGIIASHQGTVKVESAVGRGTRFEIVLPAKDT
jgi:two-component system, NtrC family, sensor kinase